MEMTISNPTTLFHLFTDPKFVNSTDKLNCVKTAILRYYLTAHTGKRIKGERLNEKAINKQIKKLKKIEVDSSFDINAHLELIKKGGEMYGKSKTQMKPHVSYGKRFFEFVSKSVITSEQNAIKNNKDAILSYEEAIMDKSEYVVSPKVKNRKIILENDPNLYLSELKNKYPNLSDQKLYKKAKFSLNEIFKTLDSFIEYRKQKSKKYTYNRDRRYLLRFIGWYKEYHDLSIDLLSIEDIFPIISPYEYSKQYNLEDISQKDFSEIARKDWVLKLEIKYKSKDFRKVLIKFLHNYQKQSSKSNKKAYIQALINFTHFLYRDITDIEENDDFQDISLIKTLRVCMRDLDKDKQREEKNIEEEKIIPFVWKEIEAVCERLRREANQNNYYRKTEKNYKGGKLNKRRKALHIQDFLAIAFFCVMPPDRQRTFRELTFGKTLKYGVRDKRRNIFTSYDRLKPGEKPKYYIHLLPSQYKTGDIYGTYWHEINNVQYEDGKRFYDYLNQWFFEGYRDELATAGKTDAVFIRTLRGIGFRDSKEGTEAHHFGKFIKNIFQKKTKFPLNPHALRDIYVTHIYNENVPEETRKAIAYMMHHDPETANKIYNKQTLDERMASAIDYLKKYHSTLEVAVTD